METLSLHEHGQYILAVQTATNSTSDSPLKCPLTTKHAGNNIYIPLIIGGVILLILFIACILAQRMKLQEYLIDLKNRCFKYVPPQESTHSYDLQAPASVTAMETINAINENPTVAKLPPIQKPPNVIVPRSKRLLSLDAFRGFSNTNNKKKLFLVEVLFLLFSSFSGDDIC